MNYRDMISQSITYMENHLTEEISARSLAKEADYSFYHFCHIFKAVTGLSPGEYLRRLRLIRAAEKISEGMSVTEAAFLYGFDSHPGFTKAFRRYFGVPPARLNEILAEERRGQEMKEEDLLSCPPRLEYFSGCHAFGYLFDNPGTEKGEDHGSRAAYWEKIDFHSLPGYPEDAHDLGEMGFWWHPDDVDGKLDYFFGYMTDDQELPQGFCRIDIPSASYMVFSLKDTEDLIDRIRAVWHYIFTGWFGSRNPYLFDEKGLCFELYRGSEASVCIPVR